MSNARKRVNHTLAARTVEILSQTGNASRYLDATVLRRHQRWTCALMLLGEAGWNSSEILNAISTLGDFGFELSASGRSVPDFLRTFGKIPSAQVENLEHRPDLVYALIDVCEEVEYGNHAVIEALKRHDAAV